MHNNKKGNTMHLILAVLSLFVTGSLFAQSGSDGSDGPTGAPTFNYMTEKIHSSRMNTSQSTTTYFDGLGRVSPSSRHRYLYGILSPLWQASFTSNGRKDLSELKKYCLYSEYDARQRPYNIISIHKPFHPLSKSLIYRFIYRSLFTFSDIIIIFVIR